MEYTEFGKRTKREQANAQEMMEIERKRGGINGAIFDGFNGVPPPTPTQPSSPPPRRGGGGGGGGGFEPKVGREIPHPTRNQRVPARTGLLQHALSQPGILQ
jgi:hypothetical protein